MEFEKRYRYVSPKFGTCARDILNNYCSQQRECSECALYDGCPDNIRTGTAINKLIELGIIEEMKE